MYFYRTDKPSLCCYNEHVPKVLKMYTDSVIVLHVYVVDQSQCYLEQYVRVISEVRTRFKFVCISYVSTEYCTIIFLWDKNENLINVLGQ